MSNSDVWRAIDKQTEILERQNTILDSLIKKLIVLESKVETLSLK